MINRKNLSQIKCIVAQVDGFLTDGQTWLNHQGHKQRKFSVRDSLAIRRLLKAGYGFAVVYDSHTPQEDKEITDHFSQLGVQHFLKSSNGKADFSSVLSSYGVTPEECVLMIASPFQMENKFGISIAASNSSQEVRTSVEHVTGSECGEGALAEFSKLILDHGSYSPSNSSPQLIARKAANL